MWARVCGSPAAAGPVRHRGHDPGQAAPGGPAERPSPCNVVPVAKAERGMQGASPFYTVGHSTRSVEDWPTCSGRPGPTSLSMSGLSRARAPIRSSMSIRSRMPWPPSRSAIGTSGSWAACAGGGKTSRHRLNRGGNRRANAALYRVAVVRMRYHRPTREYIQRRTNEGKSPREIRRCLKRYIAREIYRHLCTGGAPVRNAKTA